MATDFPRNFGPLTSPVPLSYLDDNFGQLQSASTSTVSLAGAALIGFIQSGSGASSRSVQAKLRELCYSVTDFGATGDGVADDTAEIQAAIDAAETAGGGTVFVPEGTFLISSAIVMDSANVTLMGTGRGSIIKSTTNDNILEGASVANICVRDLQILGDGTSANQAGISWNAVTDSLIHNVYVKSVGHDGILLITNCIGNTVSDCHVDGAGDDGINIGGGSGTADTTVVGNVVENCTNDGIHISVGSARTSVVGNVIKDCDDGIGLVTAQSASIVGNTIYSCTTTGIISSSVTEISHITISSNTLEDCPVGISLLRCEHTTVANNNIKNSTTVAISLTTNQDHYDVDQIISGNNIDGGCTTAAINVVGSRNVAITSNAIAGVSSHGIQVSSATSAGCSYIVIANNVIRDPTGSGIVIGDGTNSEHFTITGNVIDTAGARGIYYLGGTYFSITNNRCIDCVERGIYLNGQSARNGRGQVNGNTIEGGCSTAGIAFANYSDVFCNNNSIYNIGATFAIRVSSGEIVVGENLYEDIVEGDRGALDSLNVKFMEDFTGDVLADQWGSQVGTDAQVVAPAILAGQFRGVSRMTTGNDAAADMATNGVQLEYALNWQANQGGLVCEFRISISAITAVAVFIGLTDQVGTLEIPIQSAASADTLTNNATNAVGVLFDTAMATDNWWMVGVDTGSLATAQNSAVAPSAGTMETWRIEINTSGTAVFFRNGAVIGTAMTDAVKTDVPLTPVIAAFSGAASRNIDCDFFRVQSLR